jgi:hypothetical protein
VTRRARRNGSLFWGCSLYPKCDFTTSHEPVGAIHDTDTGPIARKTDGGGLCLACGAAIELPRGAVVGQRLTGGPPDPEALAKPNRGGRRPSGGGRGRATNTRGGSRSARGSRRAEPAREG